MSDEEHSCEVGDTVCDARHDKEGEAVTSRRQSSRTSSFPTSDRHMFLAAGDKTRPLSGFPDHGHDKCCPGLRQLRDAAVSLSTTTTSLHNGRRGEVWLGHRKNICTGRKVVSILVVQSFTGNCFLPRSRKGPESE